MRISSFVWSLSEDFFMVLFLFSFVCVPLLFISLSLFPATHATQTAANAGQPPGTLEPPKPYMNFIHSDNASCWVVSLGVGGWDKPGHDGPEMCDFLSPQWGGRGDAD
jgi:hypothetical protein